MVSIALFSSSRAPSALPSLNDLLITMFTCLVMVHPDVAIFDQNFDILCLVTRSLVLAWRKSSSLLR